MENNINPNMNSLKSKRDEYLAEIKRRKKQEILLKARTVNSFVLNKDKINNYQHSYEVLSKLEELSFEGSEIGKLLEEAYSNNELKSFYGFVGIYRLLFSELWKDEIVKVLVTTPNIASYLAEQSKDKPIAAQIIFALSFEVQNLEPTIIEKYGIPMLIEWVTNIKDLVSLKFVLCAILNLADDSTIYRDTFLEKNLVKILVRMAYAENVKEIYYVMVSTIIHLCSGSPPHPNFELIKPALPIIFHCIKSSSKELERDKTDSLEAIFQNISDPIRRSEFLPADVLSALIQNFKNEPLSEYHFSRISSLLTIIIRENPELLCSVSEHISILFSIINKRSSESDQMKICSLVKETLIKFPEQIEIILKNPIFIETLFSLGLSNFEKSRLLTEQKYLFAIIVQKVEANQWKELKERGVFRILKEGLDSPVKEEDLILLTLRGISNLMLIDSDLLDEEFIDKMKGFIHPKTLGINDEVAKIVEYFCRYKKNDNL